MPRHYAEQFSAQTEQWNGIRQQMSEQEPVRRRQRRSEPVTIETIASNDQNHNHLRRGGRVSRRLLLSIWLLVTLNFALLVVGLLLLIGRDNSTPIEPGEEQGLRLSLFQRAIEDAAFNGPDRVSHLLQPIVTSNPMLVWQDSEEEQWLKVVLWTDNEDYRQQYQALEGNEEGAVTAADRPRLWVTLAPQVQTFCERLQNDRQHDVSFRLKQYLGLNPSRRYERFVELWVKPDDLFRPCPDPETDDGYCNLSVEPGAVPEVKNVADYPAFLRTLSIESYHRDGTPWTRLGYTYDWAYGERGVGASEFMLVPNASYRVAASFSTDEYCGWDDK